MAWRFVSLSLFLSFFAMVGRVCCCRSSDVRSDFKTYKYRDWGVIPLFPPLKICFCDRDCPVPAGFLSRGAYNRVLVVSAERMSGIIDWTDRGTCCIFGDGAGAAVLGKGDGLVASHLMTKGGDDVITIPTRYDRSPWYKNEISEITSVHMNGRETYKFAVMAMSDNIKDLMASAGVAGEDVALVIPHQANYRIINEARRRIPDIAPEKFCINIDRYGNTSSASVPILLDEMNRAGKIHEGDLIILAAFGGGLSAGAMIIRW